MNFATSTVSQKQSNAGRLMRCIVYNSHWLQLLHRLLSGVFLYTYTGVGLSALLVSTYRAMRRPIDRGTSDRTGSALFRMYQLVNYLTTLLGSRKEYFFKYMEKYRNALARSFFWAAFLLLNSCITLTSKKKEITFTSEPSGAAVYRMFDSNYYTVDGINNYYIGTTPFKYKAKGAPEAFAFVKDGYYTEIVKPERKARIAQYIFGNLIWIPYGYIVDLNKISKYKQTQISAKLEEIPRHNTATGGAPVPSSSSNPSGPSCYEAVNAKDVIKPTFQNGTEELSGKKIFKKYTSAVFMIYSSDGSNMGQGSGFVINSEGLAVSNFHNFDGMNAWGVKMYGKDKLYIIKASDIVAYDRNQDYIIFKIPTEILGDFGKTSFDYIPVSKNQVEVGDQVFTIGSPKGLENTLSAGMVSQIRENEKYRIQINAPIDHGSSGGVLINNHGEAVGITSAGRDDSGANLNFAIDLVLLLNKSW